MGTLITIEGIDGSGKGTQAQLLFEKLKNKSIPSKLFSFPTYNKTFFGKEVGRFLRGEFGSIDKVHPKFASILYAGDRLERKDEIKKYLEDDYVVICDRYINSNIAHQCAKLPNKKRNNFSIWLETLEYGVFKLPKPNQTFFLDVPLNISKKLVLKKNARSYTSEKEDIHESSYQYLESVYHEYLHLCEKNKWTKIDCLKNGSLMNIEEINKVLYNHVISLL